MMNFDDFKENVLSEIRERVEDEANVWIRDVTKNNNVRLTGIYYMTEEDRGPCVYLDNFYQEYESGGMEFHETVGEIYRLLIKHWDGMQDIDVSEFQNWENVKRHVYAKLVNAKQNEEQLKTMPHRQFLDMAVIYYALIDIKDQGIGTILICNGHMEKWRQDEEALYQTAMGNMRADGEPYFVSMETVIKSFLPDTVVLGEREHKPEMDMYILTNVRKKYGASEILDKSTLWMIADQVGGDFIVLPSSVHETIILPPKDKTEYDWLAGMVQEVNDMHVDIEERLSYHVYVYSKDEEILKIVA